MTEKSKVQWQWLKQDRKLHLSRVKANRGKHFRVRMTDHQGRRLLLCHCLLTQTYSFHLVVQNGYVSSSYPYPHLVNGKVEDVMKDVPLSFKDTLEKSQLTLFIYISLARIWSCNHTCLKRRLGSIIYILVSYEPTFKKKCSYKKKEWMDIGGNNQHLPA